MYVKTRFKIKVNSVMAAHNTFKNEINTLNGDCTVIISLPSLLVVNKRRVTAGVFILDLGSDVATIVESA